VKHDTQLWTILQTKNAKSYCGTNFFGVKAVRLPANESYLEGNKPKTEDKLPRRRACCP
jgi:hypothetical protein